MMKLTLLVLLSFNHFSVFLIVCHQFCVLFCLFVLCKFCFGDLLVFNLEVVDGFGNVTTYTTAVLIVLEDLATTCEYTKDVHVEPLLGHVTAVLLGWEPLVEARVLIKFIHK